VLLYMENRQFLALCRRLYRDVKPGPQSVEADLIYSVLHQHMNSPSVVTAIFWSAFLNSQVNKDCTCF